VEDDPLLRMLAIEVVEEAGFVALEAADADEAVVLLESRPDISLLSRTSICPEAWMG
jgi:DNA-binding response OmpR family regulator